MSSATKNGAAIGIPSEPSGFDDYGSTFGVYVFTNSSTTSTSSSYLKTTCGVGSYSSRSWGGSCTVSGLTANTTYYARTYITDNQGRASWSAAKSFRTSAIPALPTLSAPTVNSTTTTTAAIALPSKPSNFDDYGQTFGVYVFTNSSTNSTSSSYLKTTCGVGSYSSRSWGGSCTVSGLTANTTYYARYYLTDAQGRTIWSSAKSFTVSAPALPTFSAPSAVTVGSSTISVPLPSKPSGFNSYGQTLGIYIFDSSSATGTYSSYMKRICGNWSYNSAPWNGNCSFNKTALSTGTYYARYYLTDTQGRNNWSSAKSFTVSAATTTTTTTTTPSATQEQQAAQKGQSYLNSLAFSRSGLIEQLEYEGFSEATATAGVDSLSADWNAEARQAAQSYLNSLAFSRSGLIGQLEYEGFTTAQATQAVDSLSADWNAQAVLKGQSYLNSLAFSRSGLIGQLEYDGFTTAQATAGVDSLTVDWNAQAVLKGQSYLNSLAFSRSGLIGQLEYDGFTTAQATQAVDQLID